MFFLFLRVEDGRSTSIVSLSFGRSLPLRSEVSKAWPGVLWRLRERYQSPQRHFRPRTYKALQLFKSASLQTLVVPLLETETPFLYFLQFEAIEINQGVNGRKESQCERRAPAIWVLCWR